MRLERGETNQSTLRHNQFEYTRYMSWKALNTIRMIGSATPREIAIHMQPVVTGRLIDLSNVELSLQRAAAVISDSTRAGVTRETKVARDNDHL